MERRASTPSCPYCTAKERLRDKVAFLTPPTAKTTKPVMTRMAIPTATIASTSDWPARFFPKRDLVLRTGFQAIGFKDVALINFKIAFIRRSLQVHAQCQARHRLRSALGIAGTPQTITFIAYEGYGSIHDRENHVNHIILGNSQIGENNSAANCLIAHSLGLGET